MGLVSGSGMALFRTKAVMGCLDILRSQNRNHFAPLDPNITPVAESIPNSATAWEVRLVIWLYPVSAPSK